MQTINVENIKCGGCASTIVNKLSEIEGISDVTVDVEDGKVMFHFDPLKPEIEEQVKERLAKLGYPEVGSQRGMEAVGSKAKSYVSCAIGKMSKDS